MAGRVEGKVAFVTGAARGQGRSHALRLAQEGADIIAIDIVSPIDTAPYALSTPDDLGETARQIKALGRRVVATEADVRDFDTVKSALDAGVTQLGKLDVAVANAGICGYGALEDLSGQQWQDMLDVNLTGVWHTVKAAVAHLRANSGGSVI
jgi:(+)-trans-carveol dehydrogenase